MKPEDKIVTMCLYGMIKNEAGHEQSRCIETIRSSYGTHIADVIQNYIEEKQ